MLQDTLLFLSLGHQVTALEQSKILFYLLQDGISRSEDQSIFNQLDLKHMNACSYASQAKNFDVIYFDPMYPPSKKNALSSGQLEYISKILEVESLKNNPMPALGSEYRAWDGGQSQRAWHGECAAACRSYGTT